MTYQPVRPDPNRLLDSITTDFGAPIVDDAGQVIGMDY